MRICASLLWDSCWTASTTFTKTGWLIGISSRRTSWSRASRSSKFVISDFGLAKVATETTLLTTFCGTLKYLTPEVFPGLRECYGPPVDIWSLGVIIFESIYGIPTPLARPTPRRNGETVPVEKWWDWIDIWSQRLLNKLEDEEEGQLVEILLGMIEVFPEKRWGADRCLRRGFQNALFKRRAIDGLVV